MRSSAATSSDDSIPVTTRHLESLIRLSQARARMELREEVCLLHLCPLHLNSSPPPL
jgi:DNA replicative helicase MCM subunit Mcm2 (Cdc46/Mcm family)